MRPPAEALADHQHKLTTHLRKINGRYYEVGYCDECWYVEVMAPKRIDERIIELQQMIEAQQHV